MAASLIALFIMPPIITFSVLLLSYSYALYPLAKFTINALFGKRGKIQPDEVKRKEESPKDNPPLSDEAVTPHEANRIDSESAPHPKPLDLQELNLETAVQVNKVKLEDQLKILERIDPLHASLLDYIKQERPGYYPLSASGSDFTKFKTIHPLEGENKLVLERILKAMDILIQVNGGKLNNIDRVKFLEIETALLQLPHLYFDLGNLEMTLASLSLLPFLSSPQGLNNDLTFHRSAHRQLPKFNELIVELVKRFIKKDEPLKALEALFYLKCKNHPKDIKRRISDRVESLIGKIEPDVAGKLPEELLNKKDDLSSIDLTGDPSDIERTVNEKIEAVKIASRECQKDEDLETIRKAYLTGIEQRVMDAEGKQVRLTAFYLDQVTRILESYIESEEYAKAAILHNHIKVMTKSQYAQIYVLNTEEMGMLKARIFDKLLEANDFETAYLLGNGTEEGQRSILKGLINIRDNATNRYFTECMHFEDLSRVNVDAMEWARIFDFFNNYWLLRLSDRNQIHFEGPTPILAASERRYYQEIWS